MKKNKFLSLVLSGLLVLSLTACGEKPATTPTIADKNLNFIISEDNTSYEQPSISEDYGNVDENIYHNDEEVLKIHFIDVGQANCTLIQYEDIDILIDGGNVADGVDVTNYLKAVGVDNLEYVVATHPHEDHIGGLPQVMSHFSTDVIYTPYIEEQYLPTTKIYRNLNEVIDTKDIEEINPYNGDIIFENDEIKFEVLFDGRVESKDYNDYSIVTKLTHGENTFIFTGDSTTPSEKLLINSWQDNLDYLDVDLLLVGHHGSSTSSSVQFLSYVTPEYSIISCGVDNEYGHPHKEIVERLKNTNIYRTDKEGTIVVISDGSILRFYTKCTGDVALGEDTYVDTFNLPEKYFDITGNNGNMENTKKQSNVDDIKDNTPEIQYVGNINSKKVHASNCSSLPSAKNAIYFNSLEEALSAGYEKCNNCLN